MKRGDWHLKLKGQKHKKYLEFYSEIFREDRGHI
jgi:hypothetical protein